MALNDEQKQEVVRMRCNKNMSMTDIARAFDVHVETVRRVLVRAGVHTSEKRLSPEELAHGVRQSPPAKILASEKMSDTKVEKKFRNLEIKEKKWYEKTPEQHAAFEAKRLQKLREAIVLGSKLERYLCGKLMTVYQEVIAKAKNFIPGTACHVDILLPNEKIAIEVDGLMHYHDFFNDNDLRAERDQKKNQTLMNAGYYVVRLINEKEFAIWYGELMAQRLFEGLAEIRKKGVENIPAHERICYITSGVEIFLDKQQLMESLRERKLGPFRESKAD